MGTKQLEDTPCILLHGVDDEDPSIVRTCDIFVIIPLRPAFVDTLLAWINHANRLQAEASPIGQVAISWRYPLEGEDAPGVLFESTREELAELGIWADDGSPAIRLSEQPEIPRSWIIAPDACTILFQDSRIGFALSWGSGRPVTTDRLPGISVGMLMGA